MKCICTFFCFKTIIKLFTLKGELVALAKAEMSTEEILKAFTGLAATPVRIMIEIGTYPKGWTKKEDTVQL